MRSALLAAALVLVTPFCSAAPLQEYRLPNGLRLILSENHERPIVRLELRTALDPLDIPRGKEGLIGYLHEVLDTAGAGNYTREAFRTFLENHALRYGHSLHASSLGWSVVADSQGQEAAFEALALAAARPRLEYADIELWRQRFVRSSKEQSARQQAEDQFLRAIGDPEHAYLPTATSIHRIENADLERALHRVVRPERSVLVVHGDLSLAQAKQLALLHLGAWGPEAVPPVAPVEDKPQDNLRAIRTWVVREAGMTPVIRVGGGGLAPEPMNMALRTVLERMIRKELGDALLEPTVRMSLTLHEGGTWILQAQMRENRDAAEGLMAIQKVLEGLRNKRLTDGEFAEARKRWQVDRINRALHPQLVVEHLAQTALLSPRLGDPMDNVKAEDLERWLQRLLDPKGIRYHLAGEVREDGQQLEKLGLAPIAVID